MRVAQYQLPTAESILAMVPELLAACRELEPRRPSMMPDSQLLEVSVMATLSPTFSNPDFDPELPDIDAVERAFLERQIERTHREYQLQPHRPWRWVLAQLEPAPLVDWRILDQPHAFLLLILEVPLLTPDGGRALLRGQRQEPGYVEDFEQWLERKGTQWQLV